MTRSVLIIVHVSVSIWQSPMYLVKHTVLGPCMVPDQIPWFPIAVRTVRGSR